MKPWHSDATFKVEISTSGDLLEGANRVPLPFTGPGPAADGWSAYAFGSSTYPTLAVSNGFQSVRGNVGSNYSGGITRRFPVIAGHRYRFTVSVKKVPEAITVSPSNNDAVIRLEGVLANGTNSGIWSSPSTDVPNETLIDLTVLTVAIPSDVLYLDVRLMGFGSGTAGQTWGIQFTAAELVDLDPAPPPAKTWHDASCDVRSIGVRWGRERFTNRYDVGTFTVTLLNTKGTYSYRGLYQPIDLKPGRILKIQVQVKEVWYPFAYGVIDSLVDGYAIDGQVIATITAYDVTSVASNINAPSIRAPGHGLGYPEYYDYSGLRITDLVDYLGYFNRAIDTGVFSQQPIQPSGRSIRDELGVTADSEGGAVYADQSGRIVYRDRNWRTTDPYVSTVTADILAMPHQDPLPPVDEVPNLPDSPIICASELTSDWSLERVVNWVQLANAGGNAKVYQDTDSQRAYGVKTYERNDFVNRDTSTLDIRANDIMAGYSDPLLRVNTVAFSPQSDSEIYLWTVTVFLNWLVRIWYVHPIHKWGYAVTIHVQAIEHRIDLNDWQTLLSVDLPTSFVELEWASNYGWDQGNWDEALWDQGMEAAGFQWDEGFNWDDPATKWGQ